MRSSAVLHASRTNITLSYLLSQGDSDKGVSHTEPNLRSIGAFEVALTRALQVITAAFRRAYADLAKNKQHQVTDMDDCEKLNQVSFSLEAEGMLAGRVFKTECDNDVRGLIALCSQHKLVSEAADLRKIAGIDSEKDLSEGKQKPSCSLM